MPIRQVPNEQEKYYLINYDEKGKERAADDGRLLSDIVVGEVAGNQVTDIFLMSHGWLGDIEDAQNQYDKWMANLWSCKKDLQKMAETRPGFKPLLIGVHWPSKPFGDEDTGGAFAADPTAGGDIDKMIDEKVDADMALLAAPKSIRPKLRKIYKAYWELDEPESLPEDIQKAYYSINDALRIDSVDREPFDPDQVYKNALDWESKDIQSGSFGGFKFGNLLAPLRLLSFWRMKDRARKVGEKVGDDLVARLWKAAGGRDVRLHLMGHSFGCIVVSAIASMSKSRPVSSMILVQGALSIWAYCPSIPSDKKKAGYFNPLIRDKKVRGPLLTTQSEHDKAVGCFYPLGAGLARQTSFAAELPKYAAVGALGIQGLDDISEPVPINGPEFDYGFKSGRIYNIESSDVIKDKVFGAGAHSDIAHPEIAHAWWQAALIS